MLCSFLLLTWRSPVNYIVTIAIFTPPCCWTLGSYLLWHGLFCRTLKKTVKERHWKKFRDKGVRCFSGSYSRKWMLFPPLLYFLSHNSFIILLFCPFVSSSLLIAVTQCCYCFVCVVSKASCRCSGDRDRSRNNLIVEDLCGKVPRNVIFLWEIYIVYLLKESWNTRKRTVTLRGTRFNSVYTRVLLDYLTNETRNYWCYSWLTLLPLRFTLLFHPGQM